MSPTKHIKEERKQIIVTCDNCHRLMAFSGAMGEEDAKEKKSRLTINPFGAPRCKDCKSVEPYSDINLMHTISIVDFKEERSFENPLIPKP